MTHLAVIIILFTRLTVSRNELAKSHDSSHVDVTTDVIPLCVAYDIRVTLTDFSCAAASDYDMMMMMVVIKHCENTHVCFHECRWESKKSRSLPGCFRQIYDNSHRITEVNTKTPQPLRGLGIFLRLM